MSKSCGTETRQVNTFSNFDFLTEFLYVLRLAPPGEERRTVGLGAKRPKNGRFIDCSVVRGSPFDDERPTLLHALVPGSRRSAAANKILWLT